MLTLKSTFGPLQRIGVLGQRPQTLPMRLARQSQVASSQGTSIVSLESPLDFKVHWLVALLCNDFLWHLRQIDRANYAERGVLNPAVRGCGDDFWTLNMTLAVNEQ